MAGTGGSTEDKVPGWLLALVVALLTVLVVGAMIILDYPHLPN